MSEEAQRSDYRAKLAKLEKLSGATFPVPCPPELGPRLAKIRLWDAEIEACPNWSDEELARHRRGGADVEVA